MRRRARTLSSHRKRQKRMMRVSKVKSRIAKEMKKTKIIRNRKRSPRPIANKRTIEL